jgi:hypothetical protein
LDFDFVGTEGITLGSSLGSADRERRHRVRRSRRSTHLVEFCGPREGDA